ncbi:MAG: 50S ribosomal protein L18Ae [Thermofilum sp.]
MSTRVPATYKVEGLMVLRNGETRKFTLYLRGLSEREVLDRLYSVLGGRHKLTRRHIKVNRVEPVNVEEVEDSYIRELAEAEVLVVR